MPDVMGLHDVMEGIRVATKPSTFSHDLSRITHRCQASRISTSFRKQHHKHRGSVVTLDH